MTENYANKAASTLVGAITSGATSLVVASASAFPAANFRVVIDNELLLVTAVSGTTFTVTRGAEGTTAAAHADGAPVAHVLTAASLANLLTNGTTEVAGTDLKATGLSGATAASRYVGATASGAPSSGTFALGDFVIDQTGKRWTCTTAGSPGTWTQEPGTGLSNPMTTQDDLIVGGSSGTPTRLAKGSDSQVLTVDPTTHHLVWATPSAGGGSAPTTSKYLLQATDASLSSALVLPGSAGWIDQAGQLPIGVSASGTPIAEEYETTTEGLTWSSAPATHDSNTTLKSHLYVDVTNNTLRYGSRSWSPGSGAFDVIAHLSANFKQQVCSVGLWVSDGAAGAQGTNAILLLIAGNSPSNTVPGSYIGCYQCNPGLTQKGSLTGYGPNGVYVWLSRDGSNNITARYSSDGRVWNRIITWAFTFTVASVGYWVSGDTNGLTFASDFLRTSV